MLPELRYELLFFYTRNELERLQPLSQSLLNTIVAGANVLPLRPIYSVDMDCYDAGIDSIDKIQIFVEQPMFAYEAVPDYEASIHVGDFKEAVLRLKHTCIKHFTVGIRDSLFLHYWKAQATAVFTVMNFYFDPAEANDCEVLDSIVNLLRPMATGEFFVNESSWHENGYNSEDLKLLTRSSFLNNLRTCRLRVFADAFPPLSFILGEPGFPNYELCCFHSNVADGIDGLIQSFVRDGCANSKLESVCVQWNDDGGRSPMAKLLSKLTKIDMPLPENDLTVGLSRDVDRVSQCKARYFVNTMQWKRMEVHKWSAEYDGWNGRGTAHILQCLVKNL